MILYIIQIILVFVVVLSIINHFSLALVLICVIILVIGSVCNHKNHFSFNSIKDRINLLFVCQLQFF